MCPLSLSLCQVDNQESFHVLSNTSQQFKPHKANYSLFDEYLWGQQFTLYMDHRPQPELSHLHTKTLARFWAAALHYNFFIQDKSRLQDFPSIWGLVAKGCCLIGTLDTWTVKVLTGSPRLIKDKSHTQSLFISWTRRKWKRVKLRDQLNL